MNKMTALETWLQVEERYTLEKQVEMNWSEAGYGLLMGFCLRASIKLGDFVRGFVIINPFK
jgi:hypothetical protein